MFGKIRKCTPRKRSGLIYIPEEDKNILFRFADVQTPPEMKLSVGDTVEFDIKNVDGQELASNVTVTEPFDRDGKITVGDVKIPVRHVANFGLGSGKSLLKETPFTEEDVKAHGYSMSDLTHLFIDMKDGDTYRFFHTTSFLTGDGNIDIYKSLDMLLNVLCGAITD